MGGHLGRWVYLLIGHYPYVRNTKGVGSKIKDKMVVTIWNYLNFNRHFGPLEKNGLEGWSTIFPN